MNFDFKKEFKGIISVVGASEADKETEKILIISFPYFIIKLVIIAARIIIVIIIVNRQLWIRYVSNIWDDIIIRGIRGC